MNCARWGPRRLPGDGQDFFFQPPIAIGGPSAQKNLHVCRFGAFENPQCTWVPHVRVLDPTARLSRRVGLQAPDRLLAPAGTPSVRQKNRQVTNTAEVLCRRRATAPIESTTTR